MLELTRIGLFLRWWLCFCSWSFSNLPVVPGAAVVGAFALLHGHAHGSEGAETGGLAHMAGFALATVTLHGARNRVCSFGAARPMGLVCCTACVAVGVGLSLGVLS